MTEGYLLSGEPIPVKHFRIKPKTLRELIRNDELEKLSMSFLLVEAKDFGLEDEELIKLPQFVLLSVVANFNEGSRRQICEIIEYILDEPCNYEDGVFWVKDKILEEDDWEQIKEIFFAHRMTSEQELKKINSAQAFNPANEEARAAMERFREIHNEISSLKARKKKDTDPLMRLVNAFCAKSPNTNIIQVWDLTYYQFRKQFEQVIKVEEYDKTFAQILAGADPKKLKLVHWTE